MWKKPRRVLTYVAGSPIAILVLLLQAPPAAADLMITVPTHNTVNEGTQTPKYLGIKVENTGSEVFHAGPPNISNGKTTPDATDFATLTFNQNYAKRDFAPMGKAGSTFTYFLDLATDPMDRGPPRDGTTPFRFSIGDVGGNKAPFTADFSVIVNDIVPEPSSLVLGSLGILSLLGYTRRRRNRVAKD